jgi:Domain of unknown function (DUF5667)
MASVFARRADEFAALVEGTSTSGLERHAQLLDIVGQLQAEIPPTPRPVFVTDLRERLMAEAETVLVPLAAAPASDATDQRLTLPGRTRSGSDRRTSRDRRIAWGVGSLALLTGAATVAVGSQVALPGDALYPVKRAIEDVSTSLAIGDGETGQRMLAHATARLEETQGLTQRSTVDAAATETSLRDFTVQANDGAVLMIDAYGDTGDESRIADLRDFTGDSMSRLVALEPELPDEARDELVAAAQTVVSIDDDARNTCPDCGGLGVVDIPISLTSLTVPTLPGSTLGSPGVPGASGGGDPGGPGLTIPTTLPTDLPTLLPTVDPTGAPTGAPTGGPQPTAPLPTSTSKAPLPTVLPTLLPTALPTILPPVPTLLPTELTTLLTPLDPITSLLSPLDPVTSLLPTLPLGVQGDDLSSPSPNPLP